MSRSAVLLSVFVLSACEPRLSRGAPCSRSSDCDAPLVCASGRCRSECATHRDCPLGARCLVGNDGAGVCTLADDRCTSSIDCGEDLACLDGACFDACSIEDCPAGGVCRSGRCERPGGSDAGPPSDAPRPRACGSDADCPGGGRCTTLSYHPGATARCRAPCTDSTDCEVAGDTHACVRASAGAEIVPVCSIGCDPFDPATCPDGESCDLLAEPSPDGTMDLPVIECRPVLGSRREDESCEVGSALDSTLCDEGYSCEPYLPGDAWGCAAICTIDGSRGPSCPTGRTCYASGVRMVWAGAPLGACWPMP